MQTELTFNKSQILAALRGNLERHQQIVAEARAGYVAESKRLLQERIETIEQVMNLQFPLQPPADHSNEYKAAITLLEMSVEHIVKLSYGDFRQYILNEWSWQRNFLSVNARYSSTASGCLAGL